ncbi:hypothetical protein, partial [uncultured Bacteroides sp.]|uniref:hypothetical protein n=1 Tax=uncultured Bacteroides sp. TaxID=162156 RepID=UPI002597633B
HYKDNISAFIIYGANLKDNADERGFSFFIFLLFIRANPLIPRRPRIHLSFSKVLLDARNYLL